MIGAFLAPRGQSPMKEARWSIDKDDPSFAWAMASTRSRRLRRQIVGGSGLLITAKQVSQTLEKDDTEWDEYNGRCTAVENGEIGARVSGFISRHFKEGQIVKQRRPFVRRRPPPFQHCGRPAKAKWNRRERGWKSQVTDVDRGHRLRATRP